MPSLSFVPTSDHPWSFQKPVESSVQGDGSSLTFTTLGKTDWWRGPAVDSTSGAIYGLPIPKLFEGEHKFGVGVGVECEVQVSFEEVLVVTPSPVLLIAMSHLKLFVDRNSCE